MEEENLQKSQIDLEESNYFRKIYSLLKNEDLKKEEIWL